MAAYLLDIIPVRQLDNNGDPVPGAKLYTWIAGTPSTAQATFTDSTGTVPLSNPIVADANGYFPQIWAGPLAYKLESRLADGLTVLWQRDYVSAIGAPSKVFNVEPTITASAGQTIVTFSVIAYTPGINSLYISVNGLLLEAGYDYTETSSSSITFTSALEAGDEINAVAGIPVSPSFAFDSSIVTFTPAGTGAVTRSVQDKLRESIVSVVDKGADLSGATDATTSFGIAAQSAPAAPFYTSGLYSWMDAAPVVRVLVPAGNYLLNSYVDTGGRDVTWVFELGATVTNYSNLPGRVERPGHRLNSQNFGILDYAAGMSIQSNSDLESPAQVSGYTSASQLGTFPSRDTVGLYVQNVAPPAVADVPTATYTATTIVPGAALTATQVKRLRNGMLIDTKHSPKYSGFITGWATDGTSITVSAWYLSPGPGTAATPANGTGAYVCPFTKVFAHNANVYLPASSLADSASGFELGVFNNKAAPAAAGDFPKLWGYDSVNLGTYKCETAFIARGAFFQGFQAQGQDIGFRYDSGTGIGFAHYGEGSTFRAYTSLGEQTFRLDGGVMELGNLLSASTVSLDFHTSGNNIDYDSRIQGSGGLGTPGTGIIDVFSSRFTVNAPDIRMAGIQASTSYANDAAAAAGGVAVGGMYRNGSVLQIRVA